MVRAGRQRASAPSSPTAGGAGTSASTPAVPRTTTATAPAFLAQLVLDFADGSRRVRGHRCDLDRAARARSRSADLLMGQHVDARRHVPGWDEPGGTSDGVPAGRGARHRARAAGRRARPAGARGHGAAAVAVHQRGTRPVHRRLRTEPRRPGAARPSATPHAGQRISSATPRSWPTASCTWTTCAAPGHRRLHRRR